MLGIEETAVTTVTFVTGVIMITKLAILLRIKTHPLLVSLIKSPHSPNPNVAGLTAIVLATIGEVLVPREVIIALG